MGLVKSPTRAASSSIVPSRFFIVFATNAGPDGGCSMLKLVRPQWPDSAGIGEGSAAGADDAIIAAGMTAKTACLICLVIILTPEPRKTTDISELRATTEGDRRSPSSQRHC